MSDNLVPMLPDLNLTTNDDVPTVTFSALLPEEDFLIYDWRFTTCHEFCQEFGIKTPTLLNAVFKKVESLAGQENQTQIFERLYFNQNTPLFIKKILHFPEFKEYLNTHNIEDYHAILCKRLETCAQSKKQLAQIVDLFKIQPIQACLALLRFTQSVDALPESEEKNQLHWLLDKTRQAWYKENLLVCHALNSPFIEEYLNTHPQWTPCVDIILTLLKKHASLTRTEWDSLLEYAHYNSPLFCETLSQSPFISQIDLRLFSDILIKNSEHLENFLNLSQHHENRFTVWSEWIKILPQNAGTILLHWQNNLSRLSDESADLENALAEIDNALKSQTLNIRAEDVSAFQALIQIHLTLKHKSLTNRERDKLPENKRYLITELMLLGSVKASCWIFGVGLYSPALVYELYNQKIAPKLGTSKTTETGFDSSFYGVYASIGKPFSGNRLFEYTAHESFKQTFLNGFKLFKDPKAGKQYFEHLNTPKMTDTEFYTRVLAKP